MTAEADLARLERTVLGVARVSSFLTAVEELRRLLAREDPSIREKILKLAAPSIGRDLAAAVGAAWNIGIKDAVTIIGKKEPKGIAKSAPPAIVALAKIADREVARSIADARKLAKAGADPLVALSKVFEASNTLNRAVTTIIGQAGNAGTTAVADKAGRPTVWVAETNACVTCLAYSGTVAKPGKSFPAGRTYGARSTMNEAKPYPPAHPHCRCTVEPLNDASYAEALRREADRSVLRGFSLSSESMKVRVDAAERLLARDVDAPKSVIAYAQRAVRAGEFSTRGRP